MPLSAMQGPAPRSLTVAQTPCGNGDEIRAARPFERPRRVGAAGQSARPPRPVWRGVIRRPLLLAALAVLLLAVAAPADAARFRGVVGPDRTITLKKRDGSIVRRVAPGRHTFVIRDRSGVHNFVLARGTTRIRGTSLEFVGTVTWTVRIRRGAIYRYYCSAHRADRTRSFRVS